MTTIVTSLSGGRRMQAFPVRRCVPCGGDRPHRATRFTFICQGCGLLTLSGGAK